MCGRQRLSAPPALHASLASPLSFHRFRTTGRYSETGAARARTATLMDGGARVEAGHDRVNPTMLTTNRGAARWAAVGLLAGLSCPAAPSRLSAPPPFPPATTAPP